MWRCHLTLNKIKVEHVIYRKSLREYERHGIYSIVGYVVAVVNISMPHLQGYMHLVHGCTPCCLLGGQLFIILTPDTIPALGVTTQGCSSKHMGMGV